jgi:hypothetical protein
MAMNPEVKAKWIEALRSGKYEQAVGALRQGDGYCCLGVLCDISGLGEWRTGEDGDTYYAVADQSPITYPSQAILEWSGLNNGNPLTPRGHIANLNDGGVAFADIADVIEAHL